MLVIRLRRVGKKNKPTYRLVVAEHSDPVNGKFKAEIGSYNPHTKDRQFKKELIVEWLNKGVRPSNTVARLLLQEKIKHPLIVVEKKHKKAKQAAETATQPTAKPTETPEAVASAEEATAAETTESEDAATPELAVAAEPTADTPA